MIGINGVYNYGCEAIVRGTVNILKQYNPALDVYYASYNYEDDVRRLSGCEVNILKRPPRRRWSYQNIKRKFLSYMRIRYEVPYDSDGWTEKFDCIFSVGGDIYTLNPQKGYNSSLAVFVKNASKGEYLMCFGELQWDLLMRIRRLIHFINGICRKLL